MLDYECGDASRLLDRDAGVGPLAASARLLVDAIPGSGIVDVETALANLLDARLDVIRAKRYRVETLANRIEAASKLAVPGRLFGLIRRRE